MKTIEIFTIGKEIPANATYLFNKDVGGAIFLYYEVPVKKETEKRGDTYKNEIDGIIDYLNAATGKNFSKKTDKTRKLILKWIRQGYKVTDFETAIDNKVADWLGNDKMEPYLRPDTLFGNKFESYYNENSSKREDPLSELDAFMGGSC